MYKKIYSKLRSFLKPRYYYHHHEGVLSPQGRSWGKRYWVLARSRLRYRTFPLIASAKAAERLAALELEIRKWAPFEQIGFWIDEHSQHAGVWVWDAAEVKAAMGAQKIKPNRFIIVPEPAITPQPGQVDALRLVESDKGVEGQFWQGHGLLASRWWPQIPDMSAWLLFQRGASVPAALINTYIPTPIRENFLPQPWTKNRQLTTNAYEAIQLRSLAFVFIPILVIYGFSIGNIIGIFSKNSSLEQRYQSLQQEAAPILAARDKALETHQAVVTLRGMDEFPAQLALMAAIAQKMPTNGAYISGWNYQIGQLELTIQSPQKPDTAFYVAGFEATGLFEGVLVDRIDLDNSLRLKMKVKPKWP
jgi:hypothetical protein